MEKDIERWLGQQVQKLGGLWIKFTSPGMAGVPDRILIWKGQIEFVEMKTETGKLSVLQKATFAVLNSANKPVHVVCGKSGAQKFITELKEQHRFVVNYQYPTIYYWR